MTRDEFGDAYQVGHDRTIRFLLSRGAAPALVPDITQSAWLRGWEMLSQLRDPRMIVPWVNSIAFNEYKRIIRIECLHQELQESDHGETRLNLAAIDISRMLRVCRPADRKLLEAQMMGVTAKEIALQQGLPASSVRIRFLRARRSARIALETRSMGLRKPASAAAGPRGRAFAVSAQFDRDHIWSRDRPSSNQPLLDNPVPARNNFQLG